MACGTIGGARASREACPRGDNDEHDEHLKSRTNTGRKAEEK